MSEADPRTMLFRSMEDGEALDTAFEAYWPAYREWMAKPKKRKKSKSKKKG